MSALVANALTGCGLFLAWIVYRLQSASSRSDEISAARAVLLAVQHGMVGAEGRKGWGAEYFDTSYAKVAARSEQCRTTRWSGRAGTAKSSGCRQRRW